MSTAQIRKALIAAFGPRKYRITRRGEIHVYNKMPNTNKPGWWFFGWLGDADTEARICDLRS